MSGWLSMEGRIARTRLLVDTMMEDAALKAAGSTVGIDDAALARGAQLVQAAEQCRDTYVELEGAWDKLRTARKALRDTVVSTYMPQRRIARLGIEDIQLRKVLDIAGNRERAVIEQHAQMTAFYTNGLSNAAALKELNRIGVTRAMLESGRDTLAQILSLVKEETIAKGKKEEALDLRDEALDAMDGWYDKAHKGMVYATSDNPTLMTRLEG